MSPLFFSSYPRLLSGFLVVLALTTAYGCAQPKLEGKSFPVEGTVRWKDGTDASGLGGYVELEANGKVVKVDLASDGTFTLDEKLPAGKYRARVVVPPPKPDAEYELDSKFQKFETSGLTLTVGTEEPQRIALVLTRTQRTNRS